MEHYLQYTILFISVLKITSLPTQNGCAPLEVQENRENVSIEVPFPSVFNNIAPMLRILQSPQYITHVGAKEILKVFQRAKEKKREFEAAGGKKNYPLIVLEGLAGSGKTTLVRSLAKKINGVQSHSPSSSAQKLRRLFLNDTVMDNLYHYFSHYITGLEVSLWLKDSPVILDRFWHSSSTYSIARAAYNTQGIYTLPPRGDKIYNWPDDLLKPDAVLFLDVDETSRVQRINLRLQDNLKKGSEKEELILGKNELLLQICPDYRNNIILAYKNMDRPAVTFLNASLSVEDVLDEAYSKVKPLLGSSYQVS
ncbi:UMP-CMP kinase 2, mitochondrial-like [Diorhabda sublineata]|uniref:UMP-CMP kinase 2, mitochondrial-like n=1 Tax=Diorhabda sublineata TaxID=1163346 RepID=UPI0024E187F0|nr:UMP-CMP kinase 2, mitochondrial-like [Diorhabda sublineata]